MKQAMMKLAILSASVLFGASVGGASFLTVGPNGQYATPCPAIKAAAPGDTIQIDANHGVPYTEPADPTKNNRSDCVWFTNNLTIIGVNGRPVLDAAGEIIEKGIFNPYGAGTMISNLEMRHAATQPGQGDNGAAVRVDSGSTASPAGGDITIEYCYIHDNQDGVLTANVGPATGQSYLSAHPYITFSHDEFAYNGVNGDGHTHNMYIGFDGYGTTTFTLEYSWSHDVYLGHTVKSRAPINNILYNLITDEVGTTSYLLDFPLGGSTYVVGNSLYKSAVTNGAANKSWMMWRDVNDNTSSDPEYDVPLEDLHFINNSVVLDPQSNSPAFVLVSCANSDASTCPAPGSGPVLSVNAVVENNIFVGPPTQATNQTTALASNNLVEAYSSGNLASIFVDWAHYNYHLAPGSPAIGTGRYPPTDNSGAADPKALALYEYVHPISDVARRTPTGSNMDEGAYSYPRVDTPPSPSLSYTTSLTTPGTGTITLTGLPTPPAGQFNNAAFVSGDTAVIAPIAPVSSTTGTVTATFTAAGASTTTTVPIDIYVNGAHLTASVTVVPGPVALQSITLDSQYYPRTTVHLTNASSSPVVIDLSTTDASILAVPATITIPAGQLSAETGSETGSLWGQTPSSKNATITAAYSGGTVSLPVTVYAPYVNHFYCNVYPCTVIGGQPINNFQVAIAGDFPASGGPVTFTSDTPSVIPNQTFQAPGGNFYTGFTLATNNVTSNTTVTLSISVNGSTKLPNQVVTVTPASGTNVAVSSGSGQAAAVGTNFSNPLVALVQNGSTPVAGATVTFAGAGVSFPNGATAVTNSSGLASVAARPTTTGTLTVTASTAGATAPASFTEAGTTAGGGGTTILAIDSGGAAAGSYAADEFFTGGAVATPATSAINTSLVTNPAPQAVYQTWRYGVFSYSITGLTAGANYTVRLHFAEDLNTAAGQRQFNVAINNNLVLTNFDIFATAGGANTAIAESFAATADGSGAISIQVTKGAAGNPLINGIEIQSNTVAPQTVAVSSGSGQTAVVGSNFANPLIALVQSGSTPIGGVTVTFAGSGVSFPSGATAVTNSSGLASVTVQPTTTGALSVTASVAGAGTPATFTETGTGSSDSVVVAIDSAGPAVGNFAADEYVVGGSGSSSSATFDTTGVVNPAPQTVYQTQRYGASTYTIPGLTAGSTYTVRLHFAEQYWNGTGQRVFNVAINGNAVLTNFDILATAGAKNKVIVETFSAIANANGQIVISFTNGAVDLPAINGIEVLSTAPAVAIDSAGPAAGAFTGDEYVSGGNASSTSATIDTTGVLNPAPQTVYQTQRWGPSTYTIPGLTAGSTYTVRLHFDEQYWNGTGQRLFNVAINGTTVLTNFDILAAAGAKNKAIVETYTAVADASGQIIIIFTNGTVDNAAINGIEIQ